MVLTYKQCIEKYGSDHMLKKEIAEGTHYEIGKYGRMRWEYLKNHHRGEYINLLMNGRLNEYLHEVDICVVWVRSVMLRILKFWCKITSVMIYSIWTKRKIWW